MNWFHWIIPLLATLTCISAPCGEVQLALNSQAIVDGRMVTLRDIAKPVSVEPEMWAALGGLELMHAPAPGAMAHVSRQEVRHLLHVLGRDVTLAGASAIEIQSTAELIAEDVLIAAAQQFLANQIGPEFSSADLHPEGSVGAVWIHKGQLLLRPRPLGNAYPRDPMTVWLDVLVDGAFQQAVPVRFHVHAMQSAWVAKAALDKGQTINCTNLTRVQIDIAVLGAEPLTGSCDAIEGRLKRSKSSGEPVLVREIEMVPTVTRGEPVILNVLDGAVQLQSRAVALTDGRQGERIPVRASLADEPVLALVVGPGQVRVVER